MKVYLNDEEKYLDPRLLYDILRGLKALCDTVAKLNKFSLRLPNGPKLQIRFINLAVDLSLYYLSRSSFCRKRTCSVLKKRNK